MSGVRVYTIVITVIFSVCACGKVSEDDARKMDLNRSQYPRMQVTAEGINGSWQSDCKVEDAENGLHLKVSYSLNQGLLLKQMSFFRDRNCQSNQVWQRRYAGQYLVDADQLKQIFFNLTILSIDATWTTLLNLGARPEDRYCKADTAYETGVEKVFSSISDCGEQTEQVSKLDLRGSGGFSRELFIDRLRFVRSGEI